MKNSAIRLIAAAVISSSFMMPVLASAQTASSTDDQVKTLMEQIRQLQQQLMLVLKARQGSTATTTPPMMGGGMQDDSKRPCPAFARDLRRGSKGDDVRDMQEHLAQAMPDVFSSDNVTGVFGPMTEKALKRFQAMNGVASSTGVFGPKTRGEMGKRCGEMMGLKMGQMGSTTRPWADGEGRGPRPMMGSTTMPRPDGMRMMEDTDGDHRGPRPMMPPPLPGVQQ